MLQEQFTPAVDAPEEETSKTYLFEPNSFKPLAVLHNGRPYYYHLDHLGTPLELTDDTGTVVWAASYRSYGNLALKHIDALDQALRFQGQYFDEETGLHYNRFRYYDPGCGRFINQDPIGLLGGVNNYQYVPNPTGWVDPLGLTAVKEDPARAATAVAQPRADFYVGPAGPAATLPSTAYRYERYLNDDGTEYKWGQEMLNTKQGRPTYFGFEQFDTGAEALNAFQIKGPTVGPDENGPGSWSDGRIRGTFDTLQLYEDGVPQVRVPFWAGDTDNSQLEPHAEAYSKYGDGGAVQLHADRRLVTYDSVDILPEN